jgi:hypothetical protein
MGLEGRTPPGTAALFNRTSSSGDMTLAHFVHHASTASRSLTSARVATACPPCASISRTTACASAAYGAHR